jgi:hypothetical protein
MINTDPNMGRKQIFKELPIPSKIKEGHSTITYIYKGIFIAVKLLLDIRLNLVKISEGKKINTRHQTSESENTVIKESDNIK